MTDRQRQIAQLEKIFDDGARSPFFKRNDKHPMPQDTVPRIAYSDIMDRTLVIRAAPSGEFNSFWDDQSAPVVATYDSMEAHVDDGWVLD